MKQNTLDPERQKTLCNYLEALNSSTLCYATRGKYAEAVRFFLLNADTVSRRGYNNFKKAHQQEIVYMPWMTDAVPDLLGHGSIDITRIYLQKSKEEQKLAYNRNITW